MTSRWRIGWKRIEVIEPSALERLAPREGKDLLSLVTCTPYGLNTHRLVVTGERDGSASVEEPPQKESCLRGGNWRLACFRSRCLGRYADEERKKGHVEKTIDGALCRSGFAWHVQAGVCQ